MTGKVINIRTTDESHIYIGRRRRGLHYGNPFSHLTSAISCLVATRAEAMACFRVWIEGTDYQDVEPERRQWVLDHVAMLYGCVLGCYCKPEACHGDILLQLAAEVRVSWEQAKNEKLRKIAKKYKQKYDDLDKICKEGKSAFIEAIAIKWNSSGNALLVSFKESKKSLWVHSGEIDVGSEVNVPGDEGFLVVNAQWAHVQGLI